MRLFVALPVVCVVAAALLGAAGASAQDSGANYSTWLLQRPRQTAPPQFDSSVAVQPQFDPDAAPQAFIQQPSGPALAVPVDASSLARAQATVT
jgi:hypothetical protein